MSLLLAGSRDPAQRILYVFGKDGQPAMVRQQLSILEPHQQAWKERDLLVRTVEPGDSLYGRYEVRNNAFTVILIGKDGGEKYRSDSLVQPKALMAIIDAMPMRKQEMKRKKKGQ
ncbi:DUF4174 domain-containing protein [Flavihumibacter rivuli]|uniref:DUF4174 domain-containing protein n=1 Tax=Flavihumibacter rivuli TaxID=2838156 RepID=UPI001BDEE187|nr:DUF4174 domain-containing protein [Flavihumibacter rivuli]ULQ57595.1 DUF4174 domain-containing protein [Flavihumibacter rivuli]